MSTPMSAVRRYSVGWYFFILFVAFFCFSAVENDFNACSSEEVDAVGETILFAVDYAFDACLYYELGTFDAGRGGYVECGTVAVVA